MLKMHILEFVPLKFVRDFVKIEMKNRMSFFYGVTQSFQNNRHTLNFLGIKLVPTKHIISKAN